MAYFTLNLLKIHTVKQLRTMHTSLSNAGQSRTMKKVLGTAPKKKSFKYHETPILPTPKTFTKGSLEGKRSHDSKRATVLNKLFMRHITDLMATGESAEQFVGYGLEINRVQITPDFGCVKVYWIARGAEQDDVVENILNKNAGGLRHELAQLKIVGVIPKIKFVKDKQYARAVEVDRLLSKADYGDDYVPVDFTSKFKTELELTANLSADVVQQMQSLDKDAEEYEEPLPAMPQNVFGLEHLKIMEQVRKGIRKSQLLHRCSESNDHEGKSVNENPIQFTSSREEREAFKEFLRKRQILKSKVDKSDKNYRPEMELLHEEALKCQEEFQKSNERPDGDFLEEEENAH